MLPPIHVTESKISTLNEANNTLFLDLGQGTIWTSYHVFVLTDEMDYRLLGIDACIQGIYVDQ